MNTATFIPTHYLRVEGVNLAHVVADTADLSTRRGGSLLLLRAITRPGQPPSPPPQGHHAENVRDWLRARLGADAVEEVSGGASSGLFALRCEGQGAKSAVTVRDDLAKWLRGHPQYQHATFVVDVELAPTKEDDFREVSEKLLARNRHRQMTTPSLVFPGWNSSPDIGPCALDRLRPGTDRMDLPGIQNAPVSPSVKARREFGRGQKKQFYEEEAPGPWLAKGKGHRFVLEFEDLAKGTPPDCRRLDYKLAILYLDGNQFGALQRAECKTRDSQKQFDTQVRDFRRGFLTELLNRMGSDTEWWTAGGDRRLETLLWGGDEMMFVVPAWAGWDTLRLFFEVSAGWKVKLGGQDHQLTHAAGLVFAHHKAPVHRLEALAKYELAEGVKSWLKDRYKAGELTPRDPAANRFDYEVLESFDHLGGSLERYRKRRFAAWLKPEDFHLPGNAMAAIAQQLRALARPVKGEPFPARQLHLAVHKLLAPGSRAPTAADFAADKLEPELRAYAPQLTTLAGLVPSAALWFHLAALWDYVARTPHSLCASIATPPLPPCPPSP
jgi:hypothetical protein